MALKGTKRQGAYRKSRSVKLEGMTRQRLYDFKDNRENVALVEERLRELRERRDLVKAVQYDRERVSGGPIETDLMAARLVQIEELIEKYSAELEHLLSEEKIIKDWCDNLEPRDKRLIRLVFFDGITQAKVADMWHTSPDVVCNWIKRITY